MADYIDIPKREMIGREGKPIHVGDTVVWYDPEEEARDLNVVWTVNEIKGDLKEDDTIILITSQYGSEAEVFSKELLVINNLSENKK